jgi:hypothetical protein
VYPEPAGKPLLPLKLTGSYQSSNPFKDEWAAEILCFKKIQGKLPTASYPFGLEGARCRTGLYFGGYI